MADFWKGFSGGFNAMQGLHNARALQEEREADRLYREQQAAEQRRQWEAAHGLQQNQDRRQSELHQHEVPYRQALAEQAQLGLTQAQRTEVYASEADKLRREVIGAVEQPYDEFFDKLPDLGAQSENFFRLRRELQSRMSPEQFSTQAAPALDAMKSKLITDYFRAAQINPNNPEHEQLIRKAHQVFIDPSDADGLKSIDAAQVQRRESAFKKGLLGDTEGITKELKLAGVPVKEVRLAPSPIEGEFGPGKGFHVVMEDGSTHAVNATDFYEQYLADAAAAAALLGIRKQKSDIRSTDAETAKNTGRIPVTPDAADQATLAGLQKALENAPDDKARAAIMEQMRSLSAPQGRGLGPAQGQPPKRVSEILAAAKANGVPPNWSDIMDGVSRGLVELDVKPPIDHRTIPQGITDVDPQDRGLSQSALAGMNQRQLNDYMREQDMEVLGAMGSDPRKDNQFITKYVDSTDRFSWADRNLPFSELQGLRRRNSMEYLRRQELERRYGK